MRIGFILIAFFSLNLNAQPFNSGIFLGTNTSQIEGDSYKGFNKIGYQIGVFTSREISSKLDWKLGLSWINKGSFKPSEPDLGIFGTYKISLNYVEIPFTLEYPWKGIIIEGGLLAGVLISAKEEDENGQVTVKTLNYNFGEIGWVFGLQYPFSEKVKVNLRYSRSLLPIADSIEITRFGLFGGSFNNLIQINFSYQFLKKS